MSGMRSTPVIVAGVLLLTGLVRGATSEIGAVTTGARTALADAAAKGGLATAQSLEDASPVMALAKLQEIAPGSEAAISVSGSHFGANTRFAMVGRGFSMTRQAVATNSLQATVSVAAGTLPSAALLRATNKGGLAELVVAYVGGSWQLDGTTNNGWRVRLSPAVSGKPGVLAFKGEFFEGASATPFTTRDATIGLEPQTDENATYTLRFKALDVTSGLGDAECDPIMKRANELAGQLMQAKTQADEDRISAEVDKIQDKVDTCVEKQQESAAKTTAKLKEASRKADIDARQFGCSSLELTVTPAGAAEGAFSCTTGTPQFKGTMKLAGK